MHYTAHNAQPVALAMARLDLIQIQSNFGKALNALTLTADRAIDKTNNKASKLRFKFLKEMNSLKARIDREVDNGVKYKGMAKIQKRNNREIARTLLKFIKKNEKDIYRTFKKTVDRLDRGAGVQCL